MQITIASRHMDVTEPLRAYAEQKVGKLNKYYDRITGIEVIFASTKLVTEVEVIVSAEHRQEFVAHHADGDAYACVDGCIDKLERQITEHKKKDPQSKTSIADNAKAEFQMKLREFIVEAAIVPELAAGDRDGALRELVTSLSSAGALDPAAVDDVVAALIKREHNGSTGFGKGVAVPHVKHAKVSKMVGTIGRSTAGIDFAALDHQPVFSIVLLLSPEAQPQQHLQAMNIVFSNLQKDVFRRFLRQSSSREAIVELLDEADLGK